MRTLPLLGLLVPSVVHAATLSVGANQAYTSIQSAINAAAPGDTIEVDAGTYRERLSIQKSITLIGLQGSASTRIRPDGGTVVAIKSATVAMTGFEIANNGDGQGFDIDAATATFDDLDVHDHRNMAGNGVVSGTANGGGMRISASTVAVANSNFNGNYADEWGGAIMALASTVTVRTTDFGNNFAKGRGGAIAERSQSVVAVSDAIFDTNGSHGGGGAAYITESAKGTFDNAVFVNDYTDQNGGPGGAIYVEGAGSLADVGTSAFTTDVAWASGGAVYVSNGRFQSDGNVFDGNTSRQDGVAVYLAGSSVMGSSLDTFQNQVGAAGRNGGGVFGAGTSLASIDRAVFDANSATHGGAIAWTSTGNLAITDSTFSNNSAQTRGGAIDWAPTNLALGIFSITGTRFVDDRVTAGGNNANGGAIYAQGGTLNVTTGDFTRNKASNGGGIFAQQLVAFTLAQSVMCANDATAGSGGGTYVTTMLAAPDWHNDVFAENTATSQGGGLWAGNTPQGRVINNTFVGNRATTQGGAAYYNAASVVFRNNVVRGSGAGNGLSANLASLLLAPSVQYDAWFQNTPSNTGDALAPFALDVTNKLATDPVLQQWSADADCSNDRFQPKLGSPLINAGDPAVVDRDGSRSDIGAFGGNGGNAAQYADADGDTFIAMFDCDDASKNVFPGAPEKCNGIDDDCDGLIDEVGAIDAGTVYADTDADGFGNAAAPIVACASTGLVADKTDCDDTNAGVNPGAVEICDLRDDDCDGLIDESGSIGQRTWYGDADRDGYGDAASVIVACYQPPDTALIGTDCDDTLASVNPGAAEICNGRDDDCDGTIDVGVATGILLYVDSDGDGAGDPSKPVTACSVQPGFSATAGDCDDGNSTVGPASPERCDGIDDDCDGTVDEPAAVDATTWYSDADHDGFGPGAGTTSCTGASGQVALGGDCDDNDNNAHPGAVESCSASVDLNCDGFTGSGDADGDGFAACAECDDGDAAVNPDAVEICDGIDNNCDGKVDDAGATGSTAYYVDQDADGYGDSAGSVLDCAAPRGYVAVDGDCDDQDPAYHPNAHEACADPRDLNCDGAVGLGDGDGDGFSACEECDDGDPAVFPGADELCDGLDNDCNGQVDEAGSLYGTDWYVDADGDGFGNAGASTRACDAPAGHVDDASDCDDTDPIAHPGADEVWYDGADQACDGGSDADQDGDGRDAASAGGDDCADTDPTIYPGADDPPGDGVDQDCSGTDGDALSDTDVVVNRGGCNCDASGGAPVYAGVVGALGALLLRRRRRP